MGKSKKTAYTKSSVHQTNEKERKPHAGWLKNADRRARREAPLTLTDGQVQKLIDGIESARIYSSFKEEMDRLLRHRDCAMTALNWIFFKRGNEILHVHFGDIMFTSTEMMVSLYIEKKRKRFKVCPKCTPEVKNAYKAKFCKMCGKSLDAVEPIEIGQKPEKKVKRKTLKNPFCQYVLRWYKDVEALGYSAVYGSVGAKASWWLFPRSHFFSAKFLFTNPKPLSIQQWDNILQAVDPTMSSCMFRYGHTEKLYSLGYTSHEIKEIGDWSSESMPERYAERKGLTKSQQNFANDNRTL